MLTPRILVMMSFGDKLESIKKMLEECKGLSGLTNNEAFFIERVRLFLEDSVLWKEGLKQEAIISAHEKEVVSHATDLLETATQYVTVLDGLISRRRRVAAS